MIGEGKAKSPVDGDSTKQRCLIGVGPHQVDRGPPNRVFERTTWTRDDDDIGRSGAAQAEPGRGCAVPIRRTMEAGCSFVCGHCCSPGRKHEPRTLLFPSLSRYLCLCLSMYLTRSHSLFLSLSLSPSPSLSLPLAFAIRVSSSSTSPLSRRSFFQYESTTMIPPIVSLDVRRSMVQKFGITVSTMFNRESTHNVECVGLVR